MELTKLFICDIILLMRLTARKQRNISKHLFDISKLILALDVLGPIATGKFSVLLFIYGLCMAIVFFALAIYFDTEE